MEGVLRRGSSRACHTRLVVSMVIMSEDAKSDRPQVAAIGCRCMNSSTAWQAWLRRRSSRAQRMAWRMLVADNCGIMRAHSTAVRLDRKSTRLNSSHLVISYAVFCLKKKKIQETSSLTPLKILLQLSDRPLLTILLVSESQSRHCLISHTTLS